MNANLATSAPGNPTSSLRTWSAMSAVAALTCLSMITGVAPAVADPPTPPPKAGPTNPPPKTDATPTSGLSRPQVKPNNPKLVGNLVPADDALVGGKSLQVRIPVTRGAKLDVARLDLRPINRYLKRRGNVYVGRVPNVPAGLMHLNVTVTKGKEEARVTSRFTVQAARADLLSALPSTSGKLAAVMGPGVAAVAVTAHPRAAMFATVNGRRVDDDLLGRPEVGGARRFVVSRADGLRPGRNIVETTAYLPDGQWETIRSAVAVPADNPMAEAGVAGRRQQGATVKLDGSRSMPSLSKQSLSYSWRLVSAPAGAKPIAQPSGRTTTLPLNQPGEYVVALTRGRVRGWQAAYVDRPDNAALRGDEAGHRRPAGDPDHQHRQAAPGQGKRRHRRHRHGLRRPVPLLRRGLHRRQRQPATRGTVPDRPALAGGDPRRAGRHRP